MRDDYLVEPHELEASMDGKTIIDCRSLKDYRAGHIKGAHSLGVDYWLKESQPDGSPRGVHIIGKDPFEQLMSSMGVDANASIIAYDDNQGKGATRLRFVLKYYGHDNVRVLNGGFPKWLQEGRLVVQEEARAGAGAYSAKIRDRRLMGIEELQRDHLLYQIIDARSADEWSGKDPHGNPRVGHLPKAIHLEWSQFVNEGSIADFKTDDEIAQIIAAKGLDKNKPTVTYCQAGVRAAHLAFVLEMAGFNDVRVYDGSMHEWSRELSAHLDRGWRENRNC